MIKINVCSNITFFSKTELDNVPFEYGEIINSSEISNGIYDIDDVWNQSDDETGTGKKRRNSTRTFLGDDDKILVVSRKSSNEQKHDFPHHQRKLNVSLNIRPSTQ